MADTNFLYSDSDINKYIYKYKASLSYILGKEKYEIDNIYIHSIVIDYQYHGDVNMPLIYLVMNISTKISDIIIHNKETGIFNFILQKAVDNSADPDLWEDYINDEFVYLTTNDINKTDTRDYDSEANKDRDDITKEITIGLISKKIIDNNKNVVNGNVNTPDMSSLIGYIIGNNNKAVIETPDNNAPIKGLYIPPLNSTAKAIRYINKNRVFYNTDYMYFMDFGVNYLLSLKGKATPRKGDKINSVHIVFNNEFKAISKLQGMALNKDKSYYLLDVSGTDVKMEDNRTTNKSRTKYKYITTTAEQTTIEVVKPDNKVNFTSKTENFRAPNNNGGLIENREKLKDFDLFFTITKSDLDTSIFTPNKEYVFSTKDVYPNDNYDGKYVLVRKRELYIKGTAAGAVDERMTCFLLLVFRKAIE